jgi:apolipoprotein N-acyltransferase
VLNNVHYLHSDGDTRYYNSAYFIGPDGQTRSRYDKMHLVPFGEYIPWKSVFFFVETISKDVSAFSPGGEFRVVDFSGHRLNAIICFEAIFPQLSREFSRAGSQLFVNLTNDGWYGDSAAPYQHLQMAIWRAIENRRFLLRATNSGISAVVEPTGRIQASTSLLREAVCLGRFAFLGTATFYSRHGEVFGVLCVIITLGTVVLCGWRRIKSL